MSQIDFSDPDSSFEIVNLTDSSTDCSMEIIEMEKPSESLANVVDAESSFEVISADCSVDNIEEASESPEALESFRVFHFKSESGEDSSSSESPESPKPSEELVKSEEVSSFKVKGTPDSSNTENRVRQLARKFQKLAGRVDKFEAERNAQNHRPILEEISGTWKLSSKELCDKDTPLPTGPIFKIKAIGNRIDIFNIDKSNHMMLRRTALITSKQSTPTEYHDFVDDNQWFTVVCKEKKSSDSSVKRIVNGQLWIEFQSGGKCVKHVFERTQDVKTSYVTDLIYFVTLAAVGLLVARYFFSPFFDFAVVFFFIILMILLVLTPSF